LGLSLGTCKLATSNITHCSGCVENRFYGLGKLYHRHAEELLKYVLHLPKKHHLQLEFRAEVQVIAGNKLFIGFERGWAFCFDFVCSFSYFILTLIAPV